MSRLTKRLLALLCVMGTVFACACNGCGCDGCGCGGKEEGSSSVAESSSPESSSPESSSPESSDSTSSDSSEPVFVWDETVFEGTYTAITEEEAKSFFEGLKNVKGLCDASWWNAYLDTHGGVKTVGQGTASTMLGYALKNEEGFSISINLTEGETQQSVYGDETTIYVNNMGTKVKYVSDSQTDRYWQYIRAYDLMGHVGSLGVNWQTGKEWAPENVTIYRKSTFAYYIDRTDSERVKIKMVITSEEREELTQIFVCENDYIVAYKDIVADSIGMLLPWTGTIEKPTDLDTYIEITE